jgi:hypothetical protein
MRRRSKINFYRRVRAALLATNKRTDNSILTECNIVMPLANSKGTEIPANKSKDNKLVRVRKVNNSRTVFGKGSK